MYGSSEGVGCKVIVVTMRGSTSTTRNHDPLHVAHYSSKMQPAASS
jgi:hypothetical protein